MTKTGINVRNAFSIVSLELMNGMYAKPRARMAKVAEHLNSPDFAAEGGSGLEGLAEDMQKRCKEVSRVPEGVHGLAQCFF